MRTCHGHGHFQALRHDYLDLASLASIFVDPVCAEGKLLWVQLCQRCDDGSLLLQRIPAELVGVNA